MIRNCACVFAAAVLLAGCSGSTEKNGTPPTGPVRGTGTAAAPDQKPIQSQPVSLADGAAHLDLLGLDRTAGNTVTGRFRMVDDGGKGLSISTAFTNHGLKPKDLAFDTVGLLDGVNNKIYYPLATADGTCLCSRLSPGGAVAPKGALELYAVFPAPPADVNQISVAVGLTPLFSDVPIGQNQLTPLPDQTIDPTQGQVVARTRAVISETESEEQGTEDDSDNRRVRLSSDVLFAVNKADLTPRADSLLQGIAKQIDASKGASVTVDGHADNTGTDAINQPLSLRRAQAVADRLKSLVTRQGVAYKPAGHGAREPLVSNDTEAGRRKNRRVTVTFTRPVPAPPAAQPAQSGPPVTWSEGGLPDAASVSATNSELKDVKVKINGLHRDTRGVVTLTWTATNTGTQRQVLSTVFSEYGRARYLEHSTSGVDLVDPATKVHFKTLRDDNKLCLCTEASSSSHNYLEPGESTTFFNTYRPADGVGTVTVVIPGFTPATGIAIK